jgi:hypothetical protein
MLSIPKRRFWMCERFFFFVPALVVVMAAIRALWTDSQWWHYGRGAENAPSPINSTLRLLFLFFFSCLFLSLAFFFSAQKVI